MEVKLFDSKKSAFEKLKNREPRKLLINEREYGITRLDETLVVYENRCPHLSESFDHAKISVFNEIICPLHHYRFNLITGEESSMKCKPLKLYQILIDESGAVLLKLSTL